MGAEPLSNLTVSDIAAAGEPPETPETPEISLAAGRGPRSARDRIAAAAAAVPSDRKPVAQPTRGRSIGPRGSTGSPAAEVDRAAHVADRRRVLASLVEAIAAVEEGSTLDRIAEREQAREAALRRIEAPDLAEASAWPSDSTESSEPDSSVADGLATPHDGSPRRMAARDRAVAASVVAFDHAQIAGEAGDARRHRDAVCDSTGDTLVTAGARCGPMMRGGAVEARLPAIDAGGAEARRLVFEAEEDGDVEARRRTIEHASDNAPRLAIDAGEDGTDASGGRVDASRGFAGAASWRVPRAIAPRCVRLRTGWPAIDQALGGGLPLGGLHEWMIDLEACGLGRHESGLSPTTRSSCASNVFDHGRLATSAGHTRWASSAEHADHAAHADHAGHADRADETIERIADELPRRSAEGVRIRPRRSPIGPSLGAVIHLLWQLLDRRSEPRLELAASPRILWIGRWVFPHPRALLRGGPRPWSASEFAKLLDNSSRSHRRLEQAFDRRLLEASWCLDPPGGDAEARAWAIEQAVRCRGVAAVVADGRGFRMPLTRRLHLAAKSVEAAGEPTLLILLREPGDANAISAASTRWRISPRSIAASKGDVDFGWTAALHRRRGAGALAEAIAEQHEEVRASPRAGPDPFESLPTAWIDALSRDPPDRLDGRRTSTASPRSAASGKAAIHPPTRKCPLRSDHAPGAHDDHVCRTASASPIRTAANIAAGATDSGGDAALVVDRSGEAALAERIAAPRGAGARGDDRACGPDRHRDASERSDDAGRRSDPCLPHRHHADARTGHRAIAGDGVGSASSAARPAARSDFTHGPPGASDDRGGEACRTFERDRSSKPAREVRRSIAAGAARAGRRRADADLPSLFDGVPARHSSGP